MAGGTERALDRAERILGAVETDQGFGADPIRRRVDVGAPFDRIGGCRHSPQGFGVRKRAGGIEHDLVPHDRRLLRERVRVRSLQRREPPQNQGKGG